MNVMYCVVLVTAKDITEAERITGRLLEEKLIACANIVKDIKSIFWWEGKIDTSDEVLMVLKTEESLFERIAEAVRSAHSYDVPEIIALPIMGGYKPYLNWISESTKGKIK